MILFTKLYLYLQKELRILIIKHTAGFILCFLFGFFIFYFFNMNFPSKNKCYYFWWYIKVKENSLFVHSLIYSFIDWLNLTVNHTEALGLVIVFAPILQSLSGLSARNKTTHRERERERERKVGSTLTFGLNLTVYCTSRGQRSHRRLKLSVWHLLFLIHSWL